MNTLQLATNRIVGVGRAFFAVVAVLLAAFSLLACEEAVDDIFGLETSSFEFNVEFVNEPADVHESTVIVTEPSMRVFAAKWSTLTYTVNGEAADYSQVITGDNDDGIVFDNFDFPENQTNRVVFTATLGEQVKTEDVQFFILNVVGGELFLELQGIVAGEGTAERPVTTNANFEFWCNENADIEGGLRTYFTVHLLQNGGRTPQLVGHSVRPTQERQTVSGSNDLNLRHISVGQTYALKIWAVAGWDPPTEDDEEGSNRIIESDEIVFTYREPDILVPSFVTSQDEGGILFYAFDQGTNTNMSGLLAGLQAGDEAHLRATNTVTNEMTYAIESSAPLGLHTNFSLSPTEPTREASLTRTGTMDAAANPELSLTVSASYTGGDGEQKGETNVTVRLIVAPETIDSRKSMLFSSANAHPTLLTVTTGTLVSNAPFLVGSRRYVAASNREVDFNAEGVITRLSFAQDTTMTIEGSGSSNDVLFASNEDIHFLGDGNVTQGVLVGSQELLAGSRPYPFTNEVYFDNGLITRGDLDSSVPLNILGSTGFVASEGHFNSHGLTRAIVADGQGAIRLDGVDVLYTELFFNNNAELTHGLVSSDQAAIVIDGLSVLYTELHFGTGFELVRGVVDTANQDQITVDGFAVDFTELHFSAANELTKGAVDVNQEALTVDGFAVDFTELHFDADGELVKGLVSADQEALSIDNNNIRFSELFFTPTDPEQLWKGLPSANQTITLGGQAFKFKQVVVSVEGEILQGQLAEAVTFGEPSATFAVDEWLYFNDEGEFQSSGTEERTEWFVLEGGASEFVFFAYDQGDNSNLSIQVSGLNLAGGGEVLATNLSGSDMTYSIASSVPAGLHSSFALSETGATAEAVTITRSGDLNAAENNELVLVVRAAYTNAAGIEQTAEANVRVRLLVDPGTMSARSDLFVGTTTPHATLSGVTTGTLAQDTPFAVGQTGSERRLIAASNREIDFSSDKVLRLSPTENTTITVQGSGFSNDVVFASNQDLAFAMDGSVASGTLVGSQDLVAPVDNTYRFTGEIHFESGRIARGGLDTGSSVSIDGQTLTLTEAHFNSTGMERAILSASHAAITIDELSVQYTELFLDADENIVRGLVADAQAAITIDANDIEFSELHFDTNGEVVKGLPKTNQTIILNAQAFKFKQIVVSASGDILQGQLEEAVTFGEPSATFAVDRWLYFTSEGVFDSDGDSERTDWDGVPAVEEEGPN